MANILVVEDDKLLGKSVQRVLANAGYTVVWVKNSTEAFEALEQSVTGFNLIYLDIMLPGDINGYEILRRLKQPESSHKDIPVIMLSNLGQMSEIDQAMSMGAADYVVKANIDLEELVALTQKKLAMA